MVKKHNLILFNCEKYKINNYHRGIFGMLIRFNKLF